MRAHPSKRPEKMTHEPRQIERLVRFVGERHPAAQGLAVDWMPPQTIRWCSWSRYASQGQHPGEWPTCPLVDFAVVSLNKVRAANGLALAAASSCTKQDGELYLFGQNDVGIRSVGTFGEAEFETVDIGAHGRILRWTGRLTEPKRSLNDFVSRRALDIPGVGHCEWQEYPGCFSEGRVDAGTALLLHALEAVRAPRRVYDFACGTGIISRFARHRWPSADVYGSDHDALSVAAARENVFGARFELADGWRLPPNWAVDLVVSNPPFHAGKGRTDAFWRGLVLEARAALSSVGELWVVVQREVPLEPVLSASFREVVRCASSGGHVVWRARDPLP